jgi:hypothetical protein
MTGNRMARGIVPLLIAAAGCGRSGGAAPETVELARADTLVNAGSDLLASPFDISVDERGSVYVLDYGNHRVLVLPSGGGPPRTIGSMGSGPGEFRGPSAMVAGGDTLRVVDRGNGRVQVLTTAGAYVRSFSLGEANTGGEVAMLPTGVTAFGTGGLGSEHLVALVGPDGALRGGVGALAVPGVATWDFAEMKSQIKEGRVPSVLRNRARPVLAPGGEVWAVHLAEPKVARYDRVGRRLWEREYSDATAAEIRRTFFEKNRSDPRPFAFFPLTLVADAAAHGQELFLLLNTGENGPATVLIVDGQGRVTSRLRAGGVVGARQIAVHPAGDRLYLATAGAELVAVTLPRARRGG